MKNKRTNAAIRIGIFDGCMKKFAIVDLETTGGSASLHEVIEVGVVFVEDNRITGQWTSLVRPNRYIPPHITTLTGITNADVAGAPSFSSIAKNLYQLLEDTVFLAHNLSFDFSFLQKSFAREGLQFDPPRACTVRYTKKLVPGLKSYGLTNLTYHWKLHNDARHRALGDAEVTAKIFLDLLKRDTQLQVLQQLIKGGKKRLQLPIDLDERQLNEAPEKTGVYYLKDFRGQPLYIGKANNIKQRLLNHFSQDIQSARMQHWLREVREITYQLCPSELFALLWEDMEIRRLWPLHNKAQKTANPVFGICLYTDRLSRNHLQIAKLKKGQPALLRFSTMPEATDWMAFHCRIFHLDPDLCGLPKEMFQHDIKHNAGIEKLLDYLREQSGDYLIFPHGEFANQKPFIWVLNGRFYGLGVHDSNQELTKTAIESRLWGTGTSPNCDRILRNFMLQNPQVEVQRSFDLTMPAENSGQLSIFD
jgi:DNA polymerase-3 subunit epsilon